MSLSKRHSIHLRSGKLIGDTSPEDVDAIFDAYAASNAPAGLAVHFHGGLVPKAAGLECAERLNTVYRAAGAFPVFFVWESGLCETVRNSLSEISRERIFRRFVQLGVGFVLRHLGLIAGAALRGAGADTEGKLTKDQVHETIESWFEQECANGPPPFEDISPRPGAVTEPDVDDIQRRIERQVMRDDKLTVALDELRRNRAPTTPTAPTRGTARAAKPTRMTPEGLEKLFGPERRDGPPTRGVAMAVAYSAVQMALIVHRSLRRIRNRRDHGVFTTVVEEVLRAFYLGNIGKTIWDQMKKETAEAFGDDPELHAGTAFLSRLADRLEQGLEVPRITLIGHSTGAIYICNFLKAADALLPEGIAFDVVFLAPAVTCKTFANTLAECGHRIRNIRTFAMSDELERADAVLWRIYPKSLLYLVSGLLEEEPDEPLLGMQRFFAEDAPFTEAEHPEVIQVRDYFTSVAGRLIWAVSNVGDGLRCEAKMHEDFDDEEQTLASLRWMLEHGLS